MLTFIQQKLQERDAKLIEQAAFVHSQMIWFHVSPDGRFTLYESFGGFLITSNATGRTRGAGDGTDMVDNSLEYGSPEYYAIIAQNFDADVADDTIREAYFYGEEICENCGIGLGEIDMEMNFDMSDAQLLCPCCSENA